MGRICFICQTFHPDTQATSQLFSDLLAALATRGRDYEVLAGFPAGRMDGSCPRKELWQGVSIRRGGLRVDSKRNLAFRALGYFSYCLWLAIRLLSLTPASTRILVTTNPPFAPIIVFLCSLLRGWRYDVVLLDIYPDGLVQLGQLRDRNVVTSLWRNLNRRAWMAAGRVQVLGRDMARLCNSRYGIPEAKLVWTPHWSSVVVMARRKPEATASWRRLGLDGLFVVQYSGNMGLWHDIDAIVKAADILREDSHIHFLMIGDGRRRSAAERLSAKLRLENMTWLPYQAREELDDSLSCCQAALISQRAGLVGVAVPCKLYGILAAGRAIIAQVPADSEVALTVQEECCGVVVPPGDAESLANAVLSLSGDRATTDAMGARAFSAYKNRYSIEVAVNRFDDLLADTHV